ncbi:MAG: hypothetical protein AAF581_19340 [Planctomycetota bacterium]
MAADARAGRRRFVFVRVDDELLSRAWGTDLQLHRTALERRGRRLQLPLPRAPSAPPGDLEKHRRKSSGQSVRRHLADFYEGVVETIRLRLEEERQTFEAQGSDCRAVVQTRGREADEHRARLYPHVTFSTRTKYYEAGAREAGMAAGRGVQLNHGLQSDGRPQRLLE